MDFSPKSVFFVLPELLRYTLQVSSHPETVDDPCKDSKYKEVDVDAVRAHKDEVSSLLLAINLYKLLTHVSTVCNVSTR